MRIPDPSGHWKNEMAVVMGGEMGNEEAVNN